MQSEPRETDLKMNAGDLYREETFTDRRVGTIRRLTPVKADGTTDSSREVRYVGQSQLMTSLGSVPLAFDIPAGSLDEAVDGFASAAKEAVDRTLEEVHELRRQAASSIVIPEGGGGGLGGPGGPGDLPGGGGKIKLP